MGDNKFPNPKDHLAPTIPYLTAARPVAELHPFLRDALVMGVIGVALAGTLWLPQHWTQALPEMVQFALVASLVFSLVLNLMGCGLAGLTIKRDVRSRKAWLALSLNLLPLFNVACRVLLFR